MISIASQQKRRGREYEGGEGGKMGEREAETAAPSTLPETNESPALMNKYVSIYTGDQFPYMKAV